ncbi:MAG: 30S ribosomal protein S17 [Candidatus Omnitrophota bacterium]
MDNKRNRRKTRQGVVVSDKMDKTIVVRVDRLVKHKKYGRMLKQSTKFKVHDEKEQANIGDKVRVVETRPLSKDKRWRLVEILSK